MSFSSMLPPPVSALILPSHFVTWIDPPAVCNVITLAHPMFRFPPPDLAVTWPAADTSRILPPPVEASTSFPTLPISIFPPPLETRDEAGNAVQLNSATARLRFHAPRQILSPPPRRLRFAAVPAAFLCRHFYIKINRAMVRSFTVRLQHHRFAGTVSGEFHMAQLAPRAIFTGCMDMLANCVGNIVLARALNVNRPAA